MTEHGRFVHSCGISSAGACALIEAAAASKQLDNCHMIGNNFECVGDLTRVEAWNSAPLPQPPVHVLAQLDKAFAETLAGNVSATLAWLRR